MQQEHFSLLPGRALNWVRRIGESLASSLQFSDHRGLLLLALFAYWLQWHYSDFVKSHLITPENIKLRTLYQKTDEASQSSSTISRIFEKLSRAGSNKKSQWYRQRSSVFDLQQFVWIVGTTCSLRENLHHLTYMLCDQKLLLSHLPSTSFESSIKWIWSRSDFRKLKYYLSSDPSQEDSHLENGQGHYKQDACTFVE